MTITAVNTWAGEEHSGAVSTYNVSISPSTIGNLLVVAQWDENGAFQYGLGVSGGGVTTWNGTGANTDCVYTNLILFGLMWGVVTATGPQTLIVTANDLAFGNQVIVQEFHSDVAGTWALDQAIPSIFVHGGGAASGNYPSITPSALKVQNPVLLVGCAYVGSTPAGGSTAGFTYINGFSPVATNYQMIYDLAASTGTVYSPAWSQASGGDNGQVIASFGLKNSLNNIVLLP